MIHNPLQDSSIEIHHVLHLRLYTLVGALLVRKHLNFRICAKTGFASLVRKPLSFRKLEGFLTSKAPAIVVEGQHKLCKL